MNILVLVHYHYQGICVPTALFVHNQMRAFVQAGHRVRAVVPIAMGKAGEDGRRFSPSLLRMDIDGIDHIFLRHWSFSKYGQKNWNTHCAIAALKRHMDDILKDFKPDVIHAHKLGSNTELAALLRDRAGCPLVFTSHGETGCEEPWKSDPASIKPFADKADEVVCVSSAILRTLIQAGVSSAQKVILDGFDASKLSVLTGKRPELSIMQAGHLTKQKCVSVTVEAFRRIYAQHPDAVLTIAGNGPERKFLEDQCTENGLTGTVRFTGEIPNGDLLAEMANTRFFVMPSVHEGFGIVYLEAMASGCIVIGTEGEGIADLIVSGKNGFLVPPNNPIAIAQVIEWCFQHPEESADIAAQGQKDAIALTWEKNAAQYIQLYTSLVKGTPDYERNIE